MQSYMVRYNSIKKSFLKLIILIICLNTAYSQHAKKMTKIENFGKNPGNLRMFIYADNHSDTNKIPLVVVLHGCGENAKSVSELTGWNKLSDLNSFIVLYPQQKFINNPDRKSTRLNSSH